MELEEQEANFVKLTKIILNIVPKHLRIFFVKKWNEKFPSNQWNSDTKSGKFICDKIREKNNGKFPKLPGIKEENFLDGNEKGWDTTNLMFILLFSKLKLIAPRRDESKQVDPLLESEEIDKFRVIRNTAFAHAKSMSCSPTEFNASIQSIKHAAHRLFDTDAMTDICAIEMSKSETKMEKQLENSLKEEMKRNEFLEKMNENMNSKL